MGKSLDELTEEFEKARCLLCGGKMPAHDLGIQVEHMTWTTFSQYLKPR